MRNVNLDYTLAVRNLDNTMPDRPNLAKKWPFSAPYQDFMVTRVVITIIKGFNDRKLVRTGIFQ